MKLKEKIKELEQKHRLIADNLMDAIWVVDAQTLKYEYITASVERISGYTAEEYINSNLNELLSPESYTLVLKALKEEKTRFLKRFIPDINLINSTINIIMKQRKKGNVTFSQEDKQKLKSLGYL